MPLPPHPRTLRLLYLEYDGQVFLVRRDGVLAFPTPEEVPFRYEEKHDCQLRGQEVVFAVPLLDRFPDEWHSKDEVAWMDGVDPVVRRAVNGSLTREVTGALIRDPADAGRLLMVKSSRGFTKGMWNMPGGFMQYGEDPEPSCQREIREETGLAIRDLRLLGIYTRRFSGSYFMRAFVYEARTDAREVRLDPSEIAESAWMPLAEAERVTINPFARAGMRVLGARAA